MFPLRICQLGVARDERSGCAVAVSDSDLGEFLRADLAGLYFNAVVAVITMGLWLVWRADALLLLVALQVLQMVKQLYDWGTRVGEAN